MTFVGTEGRVDRDVVVAESLVVLGTGIEPVPTRYKQAALTVELPEREITRAGVFGNRSR